MGEAAPESSQSLCRIDVETFSGGNKVGLLKKVSALHEDVSGSGCCV
jgi:hypothetical protein